MLIFSKRTSFWTQIQQTINDNTSQERFDKYSILVSLAFTCLFATVLLTLFIFLRTTFKYVYSPRLKYAKRDTSIPPMKKTLFGWIEPLWNVRVEDCLYDIGADATIFLLFSRFCRDLFCILTFFCCVILIPINVIATNKAGSKSSATNAYAKLSFQNVSGQWTIAHIVVCYFVNSVVLFLLFRYYRIITRIQQRYYRSADYQNNISTRSLLVADIPSTLRSLKGLAAIASHLKKSDRPIYYHICHAINNLPSLVKKYNNAVYALEAVFAKYFKNPKQLPEVRPIHTVKHGLFNYEKIDAIDYYSAKIENYALRVNIARESLEENKYEQYGFLTYNSSFTSHQIAKANSKALGAAIHICPQPEDMLWDNLSLPRSSRFFNRVIGNLLFIALLVAWIPENALFAIFIANLWNLGNVWPWFSRQLNVHSGFWSIVQGIISPALTALLFTLLEVVLRRISSFQGSLTKSSRERGVLNKMHVIFTFDNFIIYTVLSVIWKVVALIIAKTEQEGNFAQGLTVFKTSEPVPWLVSAFVGFSSFWIMYIAHSITSFLFQMAQPISLTIRIIKKKFFSPTPRDMFEWTSPQKFIYSSSLNKLLFFFTIAICYACVSPLVLLFAFASFCSNYMAQKYNLMYISETTAESGGRFWRPVVNRILFGLELANVILFLCVWARGGLTRAFCVIPNFAFVIVFKVYCAICLDPKAHFLIEDPYSSIEESLDHVESEMCFGHPSTYTPLLVPLVREDARSLLYLVYSGKTEAVGKQTYEVSSDDASNEGLAEHEDALAMVDYVDLSNVETAKEQFERRQSKMLNKSLSRSYTKHHGHKPQYMNPMMTEEDLTLGQSLTHASDSTALEPVMTTSTYAPPMNGNDFEKNQKF
ncbi:DUF221 family protein [Schizosaccharomyces cryophilus OY26]|uniref:DUF221 family protein n=1 Tax=Schizosaccharomyces cryophilus (strain OY26 / ATCC MYA-4695 / CBS 11777 / NBRC 106824 / NRRL Y48691) TaxID=653667 RepID=S9X9U6_SCHCR|nr:DUF221 family protein [Schizosaccharomyces cryophilus OY26]EPY50536.1 DUF221 family protein [Schizosaccharomyces cryophilus OY26]